jgi:uncharacterized UPF0160 family protein
MQYKKIITHGATFHADEILAIAVIEYSTATLPIERKFANQITEAEYNDASVLILDVGRRLEPSLGNFDHHQDGNVPATNMLILDHFCKDLELKAKLQKYLFSYVDKVDRGHIVETGEEMQTPTFNSIIRNLNGLEDGFELALQVARIALAGAVNTSEKAIAGEKAWNALEKLNGIAIDHSTNIIPNWRELAEEEDIVMMVSPNLRGGYQITSRDTNIFKVEPHPQQSFLHANQFLAVYPDFETAKAHAVEMAQAFRHSS